MYLNFHKQNEAQNKSTSSNNVCQKCERNEEICLNIIESEEPVCRKIVDKKDPTGCGGLCKINKEYCKVLDQTIMLFQCRPVPNALNCSNNHFNCGNMCIPKKMWCDGFFHCLDKSDEIKCGKKIKFVLKSLKIKIV